MSAPLVESLARRAPSGPLRLAFSGGLDSTVLLHLLVEAGLGERLSAWHVDHGLHSDSADWAAHCARQAEALGVPWRIQRVRVAGDEGLEGNARRARYDALCRHADDTTVITAHHRDDQGETLLLRLLRGAGVAGLAAIPEQGAWQGTPLWRPLLAVPRAELRALAERRGWRWLEDPGNADSHIDRNYLRHHILPAMGQRWPGVGALLARGARHQAEAAELLTERGRDDAVALGAGARTLPLAGLCQLSGARGRNLLRTWLDDAGAPPLSTAVMSQLYGLLAAPADRPAQVRWGGGWELRRFAGELHLLEGVDLVPLADEQIWSLADAPPPLPGWRLVAGVGERMLWLAADIDEVQLRPACGGEKLLRNGHHQRVNELWRVAGVPPWLRRQWPLVYCRGELASVPGVGVADAWRHQSLIGWQLVRSDEAGVVNARSTDL